MDRPASIEATSPVSRERRDRRRRRGDRRRRPASGSGGELRAIFEALDGVLCAVERTAWSARDIADGARRVWARAGRDVLEGRDELSDWSQQATRLTQTGWMLASLAASYRLHGVRAAFVSEARSEELLDALHEKCARRFHAASVEHGGAFLKVGQLVSARVDLLPEAWIRELSRLQDAAPPFPFDAVRESIEADFGRPLEALFESFDPAPIAAASIGQVHRGVTADGQPVAVKVKRPGIAANVEADLRLLQGFVASLRGSLPDADYETIVRELREKVLAELDYVAEARTARQLAEFFASHPDIVVPSPLEALCSGRVLTTAYVEGEKITTALDRLEDAAAGGDAAARGRLSRVLGSVLEAYLRMVLEAGAFQADPHPGNLLVTPDGKLAIVDFGCAQPMASEVRRRYRALVGAFLRGDRVAAARLFGEIGFATRSGRPETLHRFADALLGEIRQAAGGAVRWPTREQLAARMAELLHACQDDPVVRLPGEFVMIARVFGTLGGLFARYEPDLDFHRHVLPVLGPVFFPTEGA
jgi:ubiquinone biosynthesis protein